MISPPSRAFATLSLLGWILGAGLTPLMACPLGLSDEEEVAEIELELVGGAVVRGQILITKPEATYLDLGYDLLRIPNDQIVDRRTPGASAGTATRAVASTAMAVRPIGDQFATLADPEAAGVNDASIKELVDRFGEAVISVETPSGQGSGFVINDQGYAITNEHVIGSETRISAIIYRATPTGLIRRRIEDVEIMAINPFTDLALLRLPLPEDMKLRPVRLSSHNALQAGDGVFAVGTPLGLERSVSQGIVSTPNRNFEGKVYVQTDAAINPGNSGGPLFDLRGHVVGVTNMKITTGDNLGFAIPITYVLDFLRNRDAFAFDSDNPNTGYRYSDPPRRRKSGSPPWASRSTPSQP